MGLSATSAEYGLAIRRSLPPGEAFTKRADSVLGALTNALGEEPARVEARRVDLLREADPGQADELLSDWERVAGIPDECTPLAGTVAERQDALVAKLSSLPSQTPDALISAALALGYSITVTEYEPMQCGVAVCGEEVAGLSAAHGFTVTVAGEVGPVVELECAIERIKPAHSPVGFVYLGP